MEAYLAIGVVALLAVLPLMVVYREPAHNALDERVKSTEGIETDMNIFQKAAAGVNLTPGQRAFLKLVEGLAVAFLVAAAPVVADALSSHGTVVWSDALRTALAAGAVAVILSIIKYAKAHGDSPLIQPLLGVLQSAADRLTEANGLNEPVIEAEIDGTSDEPQPPDDGAPAAAQMAA